MSNITIEALRLAMGMQEMKARIASENIANAGNPESRTMRLDFSAAQSALAGIVHSPAHADTSGLHRAAEEVRSLAPDFTDEPVRADEQVADMTVAAFNYQALGEALSRHFGLMRLAITGRS